MRKQVRKHRTTRGDAGTSPPSFRTRLVHAQTGGREGRFAPSPLLTPTHAHGRTRKSSLGHPARMPGYRRLPPPPPPLPPPPPPPLAHAV
ncbi:hypothetical protein V8E53_006682, partial [Lactarius tabidus]